MRVYDSDLLRITTLRSLVAAYVIFGTAQGVSSTLSTCPARSINYITQTLPQQCLTSSWTSKPTETSQSIDSTYSDGATTVTAVSESPTKPSDLSRTPTAIPESQDSETIARTEGSGKDKAQITTSPERSEESESPQALSHESDLDSPLDKSKFLSFEEWKHQNLEKAGQLAENLGPRQADASEQRRRPAAINNALESFGEDSEIAIDFSGFVNAGGMNEALPIQSSLPVSSTDEEAGTAKKDAEDLSNSYRRNKDAGKTCKERSNYASFDCAATVLKTNSECKSATSILVESKDSYMLNVCSADNKYFIVELCDDILIDTIVLANFEFFSSMFRTFRVSVSDRYPVKMDRWKELGEFEARNSRAIQAFLIENPLIWARYLRIEFLTHYGAEYYCPISLLRVHGTTMMEEFNHEVKGSRGEDDADDEAEEIRKESIDAGPSEAFGSATDTLSERAPESTLTLSMVSTVSELHMEHPQPSEITHASGKNISSIDEDMTPYNQIVRRQLEDILFCRHDAMGRCSYHDQHTEFSSISSTASAQVGEQALTKLNKKTAIQNEVSTISPGSQRPSENASAVILDGSSISSSPGHPTIEQKSTSVAHNTSFPASTARHTESSNTNIKSSMNASATDSIVYNSTSNGTSTVAQTHSANSTSVSTSSKEPSSSSVSTSFKEPISSTSLSSASSSSPSASSPTTATSKIPSSSTQPPAANPSTQESFFKSVHKRLQQLEANSTLSLQYIEEQSRILRDAFSSVEKRQLLKTSTFLETLNTTVLTELRDFRLQYDQIWQSTVLELSSQREQSAQEVSALSARMTFLAEEIVFQKRVAMVQFMLILLCLGLIMFSRSGRVATYFELPPLIHNAIKRSSTNLARYTNFESPPASPSPSRPPSRSISSKYHLFQKAIHRRNASDESEVNVEIPSPAVAYSPPSPVSQISRDEREVSPSGPSGDELENLSFR